MNNHVVTGGEEYFEEDEMCEQDATLRYFSGLLRRDAGERLKFLSNFSKCAKAWVAKPEDPTAQDMLKAHLPSALRLASTAPYEDVRENFRVLLHEIQVRAKCNSVVEGKACERVNAVSCK